MRDDWHLSDPAAVAAGVYQNYSRSRSRRTRARIGPSIM
jgi:hypothetical protein